MSRTAIPDRDAALTEASLKPTNSWLEYFKDADRRTPGVRYSTTDPTNGQVFVYNSTTQLLEPKSLLTSLTSSLGADVALNNIANYFDGASVAQGTTGTWFVTANATCSDTAGTANFFAKLWDGTTVIDSGNSIGPGANLRVNITLAGIITSPAGNLKISVRAPDATTGKIEFNRTGTSKDCTITAIRIA